MEVTKVEALHDLRPAMFRGPAFYVKEPSVLVGNKLLHALGYKVPYTGNRFDPNIALQNKEGANLYMEDLRKKLEKTPTISIPYNENYKYFEQILNA
jgi:hypothetical protein